MQKGKEVVENAIDLGEFFGALWAHKIFIAFLTFMSTAYGAYFAITSPMEYTSKAIFEIESRVNNSFNVPSELSALASIAGIGGNISTRTDNLIERIKGREFILNLAKIIPLEKDPLFNNFSSPVKEIGWKVRIKNILGIKTLKLDEQNIINQNIVNGFLARIKTTSTDAGAIVLMVTHRDPLLAAKYANAIMQKTKSLIKAEDEKTSQVRLTYLSEILADALQEMEQSQQKLKNFALNNNILAEQNFRTESFKLDELRKELVYAEKTLGLVQVISDLIGSDILDDTTYQNLKKTYPFVDDVRFRRILGMSETISAWAWPDPLTVKAVKATLSDRIQRLKVEISNLESNAENYASSAEEFAKLTRETKIAEATYTVLIEQVKAQSLAAGYKPDTFKVYELPAPPLYPSAPQRNLIITIAAILGFIAGAALSMLNALRRDVYYTRPSLVQKINPLLSLKLKPLRRIARMPTIKISDYFEKKSLIEADEAEIGLAEEKLIFIFHSGGKSSASDIARMLSVKSVKSGRKVALCDTSGQSNEAQHESPGGSNVKMSIKKSDAGVHILEGYSKHNGITFFTSSKFKSNIEYLLNNFDQVYICSSEKQGFASLAALKPFRPTVVLLAKIKRTRKSVLRKLLAAYSIGIVFNE